MPVIQYSATRPFPFTSYRDLCFFSLFQMQVLCQESITTEGGVVVGSGAGPTELYPNGEESVDDVGRENVFVLNDTREALSHDGSEHNSVSEQLSISYWLKIIRTIDYNINDNASKW